MHISNGLVPDIVKISPEHSHSVLTTHLIVRGEITLREEGKEKKTFKQGDRADVGANVKHEAWIGPQVRIPTFIVIDRA
jgi:hypothetical protein